ncbi:MAG TPA: TetR/AcrR family transcriptional regulator [Phycisphaerae bacterium]|nr:TetR/AcrR family transcriptional regulator [Phycisphaerae bacterium]
MPAKKLQTEVRKDQIAQVALDVIGRDGLRGLSIARVAARVGLVPSAIYRHFAGKDQVLDAVLDLIQARLHGNVAAVRDEDADPLEQLRRLLMRHAQLVRDHHGIPRVLFSDELYAGHPERRARIHAIVGGYVARVADLIRDGQRRHRLPASGDPDVLAVMFLGLIQPAALLWHVSNGEFDVTKQAERAWQIFSQCLQSDGRPDHERGTRSLDAQPLSGHRDDLRAPLVAHRPGGAQ